MPPFGFCGASYASQSPNADTQTCMGFYPEIIESGEGISKIVLYPVPGISVFATLDDLPVRGQVYTSMRAFAVGGSTFAEVFADGSHTNYGTLANDGLPVSMAAGTTQILIASAGLVYVFDMTANTLTALPAATLTNISQVGYCDGFFLAFLKNSHTFQSSALLDATNWPPLSTATINVFLDNLGALLVDHREVWLFGLTKSVVYYDSGNFPFPFDLIPGAFIEQGIIAGNSPVRLDNSVFWLGGDERGAAVAWRARGYTPSRVSDHAVEFAWQGYAKVSDAVGYSYQDQGHSFWVLYFPTANKTWVYDVAVNKWHERGRWNAVNGIYTAHRSQNHIMAFGKHLVGDWASGKIYQMSISIFTDDGGPIRRVRRAPHISKSQKFSTHAQLQVYLETGLGPQPPLAQPSSSPTGIILADSGAHLWLVRITDAGLLQTAALASGVAATLFLNDSVLAATSWQVGVTLTGLLTATGVAFNAAYPKSTPLASLPGLLQSGIQISNGLLQTTVPLGIPRDPMLNLRWSDDGAHTWSNEYSCGVGQAGQFKKRAIWRRLGRTRDRVYEVNCSDPVPYRLVDAYLDP